MFLHHLNEDQKVAFFTLAHRVSMSDGEDGMDEMEALEDLKRRMGIVADPEMSAVLGDLHLEPFDTPKSRAIALMELLTIVYSDGFLHEGEAKLIGEIATGLGIDQERLSKMAEWAMNALDLEADGESLID